MLNVPELVKVFIVKSSHATSLELHSDWKLSAGNIQ